MAAVMTATNPRWWERKVRTVGRWQLPRKLGNWWTRMCFKAEARQTCCPFCSIELPGEDEI